MDKLNEIAMLIDSLRAPFPDEAYTKDSSRGFDLTSLKPQFIVERLCEVFGIGMWSLDGEYKDVSGGLLYSGHLTIYAEEGILCKIEAVGFSAMKKNVGDAYKSARTDALSKSSSYLLIGNDMFKGKIAAPGSSSSSSNNQKDYSGKSAPKASDKQVGFLKKLTIEKYGQVSEAQEKFFTICNVPQAKEAIDKLLKDKQ